MDPSGLADKAEFVYNNLRMKTLPVGIKFLRKEADLPEKARRPSQLLKKKITICQAMTMARTYGWQMGMAKDDVICILASLAFGFTHADDPRKEMAESFFESMYKSDMEKTVKEVDQMCFLDRGEYQALVISPLGRISMIPDTVILYGNPGQMSRILQAAR